jgi:hypothetical protein
MSIIKKSDIKNRVTARRAENLLLFRLASQSGANGNSGSQLRDAKPHVPNAGDPMDTLTAKKPQL